MSSAITKTISRKIKLKIQWITRLRMILFFVGWTTQMWQWKTIVSISKAIHCFWPVFENIMQKKLQMSSMICILYSNKSVCPKNMWNSWRVSIYKQTAEICNLLLRCSVSLSVTRRWRGPNFSNHWRIEEFTA